MSFCLRMYLYDFIASCCSLSLNEDLDPTAVDLEVNPYCTQVDLHAVQLLCKTAPHVCHCLQLTLLKHAFPFGSAVRADLIAGADDDSVKYSQTFYDNFDWSVLENDLKWRQMEWNRVRQHT